MNSVFAATEGIRISYRFARVQSMTEWWHWLLLAAVSMFLALYIAWLYRRDGDNLTRPVRMLLVLLRVMAFIGLLLFFLDLEKRSERSLTKNSRVAVLVDTSQSMAFPESEVAISAAGSNRMDSVKRALSEGKWLDELRQKHDVSVYRFDQGIKPTEIAAYPRLAPVQDDSIGNQSSAPLTGRIGVLAGLGFCLVALVSGALALAFRRPKKLIGEQQSWSFLVAMVSGICAFVVLAVVNLRYPDVDFQVALGLKPAKYATANATNHQAVGDTQVSSSEPTPAINWDEQLRPSGVESRISDALRFVLNKERGGSLAGIIVITDGAQNAGIPLTEAVSVARNAGVPVYPIGLGSEKRPVNLRIVDLEAPTRIYPGDRFTLTGYLQAYGFAGRTFNVELVSRNSDQPEGTTEEKFEQDQRVKLGADGEVAVVKFDVTPEEQGRREFRIRVAAPEQDNDATDNAKAAMVQVIERRNKVLLVAGGPMRDFQFLRNMLFRDRATEMDVWLQIGRPGISQEANEVLYEFPKTADELFRYDAIVAFDPDWTVLDELQVELLDRWVAEKAGGLILLAGPVNMPRWASRIRSDASMDKVQGLYPVTFYSRGAATLSLGKFGASSPWPIQFSRDGQESEFLWIEDTAAESEAAWSAFPGVYGFYAVKGAKPGARVYARFSDPEASLDGDLPIYMAGHFYGAGRVFYLSSGEIWRLRGISEKYFESFYTKLIRWVSQGRLMRDSNRGVLLVEKDRCLLGDEVEFRAMLTDAQHQALEVDVVQATIAHSDGARALINMRRLKDSPREGTYFASFPAQKIGDYRIEIRPPESTDEDLLVRDIRVTAPQLETEKPERNDAFLAELAEKTSGQYFVGMDAALGRGNMQRAPVASIIEPNDRPTYLPSTPDRDFERHLMTWLMCWICGVLCLEWLIRRLSRLA